jgi:hypothetical protein
MIMVNSVRLAAFCRDGSSASFPRCRRNLTCAIFDLDGWTRIGAPQQDTWKTTHAGQALAIELDIPSLQLSSTRAP